MTIAATGCKREKTHRDLATLPHVERTRGSVHGLRDVPWVYEPQLLDAKTCYDRALQKDPAQRGTACFTYAPAFFGHCSSS